MDDPWGSPWADEIQHEAPAPAKDEGEARPGTPVGILPLEVKAGVKSPWDEEDDGFGDWAADSGNVQTSLKWNSHAETGWGTKETPKESKSSEGLNGLLPSWDDASDNAVEIPSNLVAPAATIARQPSPDPWATEAPSEITLNNGEQGKSTFDTQLGETEYKHGVADDVLEELPKFQWDAQPTKGDALEPFPLGDSGKKVQETESPKIKTRERNLSHVLVGHDLPEVPSQANDPDSGIALDDNVAEGHKDIGSVRDSQHDSGDRQVDQESSRPSSSPSEHSHHDEQPLPESPRTSLDEEQGRPQMERKASSKVRELVHHFDDIIAKQIEAVEPISRTPQKPDREQLDVNRSKKDTQEDDDDDFGDDFGDFEEGMSDVTEEPAEKSPFNGSSIETSEEAKPEFGPVTFEVKTSMVGALFPGLEPDSSAEKIFIPDTQIHDCFNSVEQRKIWYRISRYGSMRKHNTGNDDNYKRISWRKSEVRVDTLKIVGRWMEEDRLGGRVVLGGASKGSSIFGWNDAAQAPVPISSALAAKRSKKISQDTVENVPEVPREWPKISSRHSSPRDHERRRSSAKLSHPAETKVEPPAVANFGWNTPSGGDVAIKAPIQVQEKPAQRPKPSTRSDSPKSSPPQRSASTSQSPVSKKAHKPKEAPVVPLQPQVKPKVIKEPLSVPLSSMAPSSQIKLRAQPPASGLIIEPAPTGEDDEWGEMVSSPIVTPGPSFPVSQLRHKRSRSFNGASSIPLQNKTILEPQKRAFELDHRPRASLDSVLIPQVMSRGPSNGVLLTAPLSSNSQSITKDGTPPSNKATPNRSTSDPWASADFSFFDSAPAPKPILANVPTSPPKQAAIPTKTVSFAGNPVPTSKAPVRERNENRTRDELEQDQIVRNIVRALPDLSYMLR